MGNTSVQVKAVLTREESFCDIYFTVVEMVDDGEEPVSEAKVELKTVDGAVITYSMTDNLGKALISDMHPGIEYKYTISKAGFISEDGWVTTE